MVCIADFFLRLVMDGVMSFRGDRSYLFLRGVCRWLREGTSFSLSSMIGITSSIVSSNVLN